MKRFSKVLAVVLCLAMLFTTAFASGLQASFVDFQAGTDTVTARVNLRNDDSDESLSGKVIIASYDEEGNLVATGESYKTSVAKGAETIVSASVAADGADYKAFVWNDAVNPNSKHAVKGATSPNDFITDAGADDTLVSTAEVAETAMTKSVPTLKLYTNFHGRSADDASEATGGRFANMNANSASYHEAYYVDPSMEGYDFFVFTSGSIDYSAYESLLEFDITKDAEVVILASHTSLSFKGYDLSAASDDAADGEAWAKTRFINRDFADALNAIGIRPTYAIAAAYAADKEGYYTETIKPVYDAASDDAKTTFDTEWAQFNNGSAIVKPGDYIAAYSKTYTVADGEETAHVVIPAESTGTSTRNIVILVKPVKSDYVADGSSFTPITKAGTASAAPALKGVEIDGTYVSIDKFTDNAYTYGLNPMDGGILPVVKGITADNSIYASTDYEIASDGKTATATITVKNLYTEADPVVYTVNIAFDSSLIPADNYDIVNLNGTTIVDNTSALKNTTVTASGNSTHGDPLVDAPVSKVSGKTYAQYIAYINEYYGYEEGDDEYIVGTGVSGEKDVVGTNSYFTYSNNFNVDEPAGVESNTNLKRQIATINPKYAFYRNLYRLYGHISLGQLGGHGFTGGLWYGADYEYATGYNANAGTDALPPVPWFEATMATKGTVYVNSMTVLPHLVEKGYTLISSTENPYTCIQDGSSSFPAPAYVYYKVFNAGEKVEIFNDNNQKTGNFHPSSWFFTTAVPDTVEYEYGKKSGGAAATSYNSSYTDGVLYKNLFADVAGSASTSGGQWASDYNPLGGGQRIKSVEDASLLGCDYFTFKIGNRNYSGESNLLEFKVDKDCEVLILTKSVDSSAVFGDYTKNTNHASLTGMFPQNNYFNTIIYMGIPTTDISMDMVATLYPSSGLTFAEICDSWISAYFPGATDEELLELVNTAARKSSLATELNKISEDTQLFATVDSKAAAIGGSHVNHPYTVSHTKSYSAGDIVAIPVPTGDTSFDRPIVVLVKPVVATAIIDHVTDFQIVAENGAGSFILGTGANATASSTYSDRLVHNYSTDVVAPTVASAYSINNQRTFGVTDEVLGLENCYYLKYVNQASVDSVLKGTANADWIGGSDKEDLAWMTFTVNQDCDIIIVPSAETPKFVTREANGWSKTTLSDYAFTLKRQANGSYQDYTSKSQKVMYTKSFKAGQTVTLYNGNNGTTTMSYDQIPYFAFVRVK